MEKGSFHKSSNYTSTFDQRLTDNRPEGFLESRSDMDFAKEDVRDIPLPTEIPQKIDYKNLPSHILRSATVDSLIQQNEDLMLRLKIQIRRNADLEDELQALKENSSDIILEIDRLRDELLIYKEKDRLFMARNANSREESEALKNKIKFLETQYAELYSVGKEKQHQLQVLGRGLSRHKKYRTSILKVARELRDSLRFKEVENLKEKALNKDLMTKLGEAAERIQFINREAQDNQKQLVESYESQLKGTRETLNQVLEENEQLKGLHEQVELLKDEKIEWNNTRLRIERSIQNERDLQAKQVRELQEALASYRKDSKERALEVAALENEKNQLLEANAQLKIEQQGFVEQVESLQCLWRDNQNQIEKFTTQIDSLQKLNQQLSQQINQYRKENNDLKNKTESRSFQDEERIRELTAQVQLLSADRANSESSNLEA